MMAIKARYSIMTILDKYRYVLICFGTCSYLYRVSYIDMDIYSSDRGQDQIGLYIQKSLQPLIFMKPIISTLTPLPNACNNKACRIKFHRYVRQFLPRDHGGFGHKNQKMSDFLGIAQKVDVIPLEMNTIPDLKSTWPDKTTADARVVFMYILLLFNTPCNSET